MLHYFSQHILRSPFTFESRILPMVQGRSRVYSRFPLLPKMLPQQLPNLYIKISHSERKKVQKMLAQTGLEKFEFLRKLAMDLGAADAKVIPADKVVVENRVVLKCRVGCTNYGKTLACPPYTPTADDFRKIVKEYSHALFIKFKSNAEADSALTEYLSYSENDPKIPEDMKEKTQKFWKAWKEDKQKILQAVLDLEKAAIKQGYPLAAGFVSGPCQLCEKCNLKTRICVHPTQARYSEDAVGVNVRKTAKNAGISFSFPFEKNPESFALLLID